MTLNKKDFIEIEFTGKTEDGDVFDSNIKEVIQKINPNVEAKPFVFCLGESMFLKGVEDFLIGKEPGKYAIELEPENAFGPRDSKLIQMMPAKAFKQHQVNPYPGAVLNFDGKMGKVITAAGGRVTVDFNHPLAGKKVIYDVNILRKVEDLNEKINAFNDFLFKQKIPFNLADKKIIFEVEEGLSKFIEMFKDKFKEIFDLDVGFKKIEKKD